MDLRVDPMLFVEGKGSNGGRGRQRGVTRRDVLRRPKLPCLKFGSRLVYVNSESIHSKTGNLSFGDGKRNSGQCAPVNRSYTALCAATTCAINPHQRASDNTKHEYRAILDHFSCGCPFDELSTRQLCLCHAERMASAI